ncbi:hypothetical protein [Azohydromonas lata]|uniref:hypothetical protein n=1 Tax=Azohydromonas lata TaxID=45677 RepID=UPI00082B1758|nr:hypothetical protein [Azohydromonas lata]
MNSNRIPCLLAAACAALALGVGAAVLTGTSPAGWPYAEGGSDPQDETQLIARRAQHNLLVMVAGHAAPLQPVQGVRLRITQQPGPADQAVPRPGYDRMLTGSWVLVDLPGGQYDVDLLHRGRLQRQPLSISPGEQPPALVFYVDSAQAAPD